MISTRLLLASVLLFLLVGSVFASTVTLTPTTALHKAYKRNASNQTGTVQTSPTWVEASPTEFLAAGYTAVQTDDASRLETLSGASTNLRWGAAGHLFTFDLTAYPSITNIEIMWDGYAQLQDYVTYAFFKKTASTTWVSVGALPTSDGAGWEIDVNDAAPYLPSNIYKVCAFASSKRVETAAAISNLYTDALQIIVTYTAAGGQEQTFHATATLTATASASTAKEIKFGTSTATPKATASASMLKEKGLGISIAMLKSTATTQTYKTMLLGTFAVSGHGTTWNDYLKAIILYGAVTGSFNLWMKSWNSSIPAGYPQLPGDIVFPPSLSVLFKTYLDEKPLPDVEISVYDTLFNGLADSAVSDMTGRATIYLLPGDYRYEALHTRTNMTREGHFLHFTYETIEIDFGTGEVKITPTTFQMLLRMVTMLCVTALGCVCIWRLKKRD